MGFINQYPYTDLHELNLDYVLSIAEDMRGTLEQLSEALASITGLQTDVSALQTAMSSAQSNITQLQTITQTHTNNINSLNTLIAGLRSDVNTINTEIDTLSNTVDAQGGYITALQTLTSSLNTNIDNLNNITHRTIVNLYGEQISTTWEYGNINPDGTMLPSQSRMRSADFIPFDTSYVIVNRLWHTAAAKPVWGYIIVYDDNYNVLSTNPSNTDLQTQFFPLSRYADFANAAYFKIRLVAGSNITADEFNDVATNVLVVKRDTSYPHFIANAMYSDISSDINDINNLLSTGYDLINNMTITGNNERVSIDLPALNRFTETPVITFVASYTKTDPAVQDYPRVHATTITNLNLIRSSTDYEIGKESEYKITEIRFAPFEVFATTRSYISIYVPTGYTLHIKNAFLKYNSNTDRTHNNAVKFLARPGTCNMVPELTLPALHMANRMNYDSFVVIPKISGGNETPVWFAYHDDVFDIATTNLRNSNGSVITDETYNGQSFHNIPWSYLETLGYGSYGSIFNTTRILTLDECFKFLVKTRMKLGLSMHPRAGINTTANLASLKSMIKKYGLLEDASIIVNNIDELFTAFGNDIGEYVFGDSLTDTFADPVNTPRKALTDASTAKATYSITTKITCGLWVPELFAHKAQAETLINDILDAGFAIRAFMYNHTGIDGSSHLAMWSRDIEWLLSLGVTEFTDGYNTSIGLNW